MESYLLRGVLIGLLFGLPVGAVGTMTVQRTWSFGVRAGLLTGLGSSVVDCLYACVGVWGMGLVCGVFLGTYLWWGALSIGTHAIQRKTGAGSVRHSNQIFGAILTLFGAAIFLRMFLP